MSTTPNHRPDDFRLHHPLQVRWSEVDLQGVVFNGHYLNFFDVAVSAWWRDMGIPSGILATLKGDFYVRKATVEYLASARMDDWMDVCIRSGRVGNSSMLLEGALFVDERLMATAELLYVFADPETQTPQRIPDPFRDMLARYAQGEAMAQVQVSDWVQAQALVSPLRREVFVHEQGVPEAEEWDTDDAHSLHAVVRNGFAQVLATGRLLPANAEGVAKLGRMAVLKPLRRRGLGEQVLQALEQAARARGDTRSIALSAQLRAKGFYERAGYVAEGEVYDEVGIAHQRMRKAL